MGNTTSIYTAEERDVNEILVESDIQILGSIGKGSYGKLYEVRRGANADSLAMKVLDRSKSTSFEETIWPTLHHENIIRVLDILHIETKVYFLMPLAQNGSVGNYILNHGPIKDSLTRRWAKHLLQALNYCERKRIAHRDVKPENMLLDSSFVLKLADFGLSTCTTAKLSYERVLCTTPCGSLEYIAPEILLKMPYDAHASDVWSAGVSIYVMCTAKFPFHTGDTERALEQMMANNWWYLLHIKGNVSQGAIRMMKKMIEYDPKQRYSTSSLLRFVWIRDE